MKTVNPEGWPAPKGYANGVVVAPGRTVFLAGQVGWNAQGVFVAQDLPGQFDQALANVLAVAAAAGAGPADIVRMTVYVTDLEAYRSSLRALGPVWRARMGKHYPAMALVGVAGLVEREALVEIEATAHLEDV